MTLARLILGGLSIARNVCQRSVRPTASTGAQASHLRSFVPFSRPSSACLTGCGHGWGQPWWFDVQILRNDHQGDFEGFSVTRSHVASVRVNHLTYFIHVDDSVYGAVRSSQGQTPVVEVDMIWYSRPSVGVQDTRSRIL